MHIISTAAHIQPTWEYPLRMATDVSTFQHRMPYTQQFVVYRFLRADRFLILIHDFRDLFTFSVAIIEKFGSFVDRIGEVLFFNGRGNTVVCLFFNDKAAAYGVECRFVLKILTVSRKGESVGVKRQEILIKNNVFFRIKG